MPVSIFWYDDDKTILIEKFVGKWTIDDYRQVVDDAAAILAEIPHTVHILIDATEAAPPPSQLLMGIQYAIKKLPPNQGLMVFVKLSRLLKMFMDFAKQISVDITRYAYAVETMEEAYQLLAEKSHLFDQKT